MLLNKISIIMSAYNSGAYIDKAIRSVLSQSYKDFELIIVNDKSTDNTLEVINSFNDDRIKLINNKINLGAGWSRDIGLKNSTGDYICFVDSDDFIESDFLEALYKAIIENKCDLVFSGMIVESDTKYIKTVQGKFLIKEGKDVFKFTSNNCRWLNSSISKREVWKGIDYSHRRYIEDTPTLYAVLLNCRRVANIPISKYHYIQHNSSLCNSSDEIKNKIYLVLAMIDAVEACKKKGKDYAGMKEFIFRLRELKQIELNEYTQKRYSEELSEIFCYFLNNLEF